MSISDNTVSAFWKRGHLLAAFGGGMFAAISRLIKTDYIDTVVMAVIGAAIFYGTTLVVYLVKKASGDFASKRPPPLQELPQGYTGLNAQFLKSLEQYSFDRHVDRPRRLTARWWLHILRNLFAAVVILIIGLTMALFLFGMFDEKAATSAFRALPGSAIWLVAATVLSAIVALLLDWWSSKLVVVCFGCGGELREHQLSATEYGFDYFLFITCRSCKRYKRTDVQIPDTAGA